MTIRDSRVPRSALATLLLITPGLFWNARFRSVIDMTERVVQALTGETGGAH